VAQQVRNGTETATVAIGAGAFLGVQVTDGAGVAAVVDGSPAARAGLTAGDTITAVGPTAVRSGQALSAALAQHDVADPVRITWTDTTGATQQATVTLAASPTA